MSHPFTTSLQQRLAQAQTKQGLRQLVPLAHHATLAHHLTPTPHTPLLNLASNDYLGYGHNTAWQTHLAQSWADLPAHQRLNAVASPLVCGYTPLQHELEQTLARWLGAEAAVVLPSGYQANVALLAALTTPQSHVFADKLNHASLVDAMRLSAATWHRYPHGKVQALEALLQRHASPQHPCFIVSDTVFSMDGDVALLAQLAQLAHTYNAVLVLDEAHACGVLGPQGAGAWAAVLAEAPQWATLPVVRVGTLSKAIAGHGAFIAADALVIDWLINAHRGLIYSTALSPFTVWANLQTVNHAMGNEAARQQLRHNVVALRTALTPVWEALGQAAPVLASTCTPIIPLVLGSSERTLAVATALREQGILCPAIRPPTVPEGQARLRLCVSAGHVPAQLQAVGAAIMKALTTHTLK